MLSFSRNQAIAVTWTTDTCHAVRVRTASKGCQVAACWHGEVGKDGASLAELVLNAVKNVGGDDGSYIVAGGNCQGWGMADLNMPPLKREELKAALVFELRKQTPLSTDKIHWGYRILPRKKGSTSQPVRLVFVRNEHWNSWMKAAEGLKHVDAFLPAPVALDPVLQEETLVLPGGHGIQGRYQYVPAETGRTVIPMDENTTLKLSDALPPAFCKPGPIATLPETEQLPFVSAMVLGVYGLTKCVNDDQPTLPELPDHFHAHRNIAAKVIALVLAVFLLGLFVFALAGNLSGYSAQIRQIDQAILKTRGELAKKKKFTDPKDTDRTQLIQQELQDNLVNGPDFPDALLAITQAVQPSHWIADPLEWKEGGVVTFRVQGPTQDLELRVRLEDSEFLGDVAERQSSVSNGQQIQRFEVYARYDTPEEAERLKNRREEIRQKELERKAQEKAAQEAKAKDSSEKDEEEAEDLFEEAMDLEEEE